MLRTVSKAWAELLLLLSVAWMAMVERSGVVGNLNRTTFPTKENLLSETLVMGLPSALNSVKVYGALCPSEDKVNSPTVIEPVKVVSATVGTMMATDGNNVMLNCVVNRRSSDNIPPLVLSRNEIVY